MNMFCTKPYILFRQKDSRSARRPMSTHGISECRKDIIAKTDSENKMMRKHMAKSEFTNSIVVAHFRPLPRKAICPISNSVRPYDTTSAARSVGSTRKPMSRNFEVTSPGSSATPRSATRVILAELKTYSV